MLGLVHVHEVYTSNMESEQCRPDPPIVVCSVCRWSESGEEWEVEVVWWFVNSVSELRSREIQIKRISLKGNSAYNKWVLIRMGCLIGWGKFKHTQGENSSPMGA